MLYKDLLSDVSRNIVTQSVKHSIEILKLDGKNNPELAEQLKVERFPTLLIYANKKEILRFEQEFTNDDIETLNESLQHL